MPSRQQLTKIRSGGGKLLLRRKTPLTRRSVAYFHSGAHSSSHMDLFPTCSEDEAQLAFILESIEGKGFLVWVASSGCIHLQPRPHSRSYATRNFTPTRGNQQIV